MDDAPEPAERGAGIALPEVTQRQLVQQRRSRSRSQHSWHVRSARRNDIRDGAGPLGPLRQGHLGSDLLAVP